MYCTQIEHSLSCSRNSKQSLTTTFSVRFGGTDNGQSQGQLRVRVSVTVRSMFNFCFGEEVVWWKWISLHSYVKAHHLTERVDVTVSHVLDRNWTGTRCAVVHCGSSDYRAGSRRGSEGRREGGKENSPAVPVNDMKCWSRESRTSSEDRDEMRRDCMTTSVRHVN